MATNIGDQVITVKYFDPVDSTLVNRIGLEVRKTGIYTGGYLTKVSDVSVNLSDVVCEITDGTWQVRAETREDVAITVSSAAPVVILRWTYTGVAAADYLEMLGVAAGSVLSTDLVVGVCSFSGSTLTGFVYTTRSNPQVMDLFLKVEPTVPASMYVRIRGGRINYGNINYDIEDQLSPLMVAPGSGTNYYAIQVNTSGGVVITLDASGLPDYNGLITLAEVTIPTGTTTITSAEIKDVRAFLGVASYNTLDTVGFRTGDLLMSSSVVTPTGWTDVSATYEGKFIRVSAGTALNTGGADIHTHAAGTYTVASHEHTINHTHLVDPPPTNSGTPTGDARGWNGAESGANGPSHYHVVNIPSFTSGANSVANSGGATASVIGASASGSNVPAYVQTKMYKKD